MLWDQGKISGEMHLGIGEEAVAAGIVAQLIDGDAMALDHRGTPQLVMRGVDLLLLIREFLGKEDGLCAGMGGHMHLYAPELLSATSGIVGAAGPTAAGFALAAQQLRPNNVAVAFFGDGAINQGMLLESFNLAVTWKLPLLFVCKNNQWSITTISRSVTGGEILDRVRGFGMPASEIDGTDVEAVWNCAEEKLSELRNGSGPQFILAHCLRIQGHFLGDSLMRIVKKPSVEISEMAGPLLRSFFGIDGAPVTERTNALMNLANSIGKVAKAQRHAKNDPLVLARNKIKGNKERLKELETAVGKEMDKVLEIALSLD
jgi:pyruvate dehydrogenase E1 component alpha subunit